MEPSWSWSMTRFSRSERRKRDQLLDDLGHRVGVGADRAGARDCIPSDRMRHFTICGFSPWQARTNRLLERDQRIRRAPASGAPWRNTAARWECFRGGCTARRPVSVQLESGKTRMLSPGFDAAVEEVPQLGALILGIPLAAGVAEGEDALLGARFFFVAAGAADGGIEFRRRASASSSALVLSRPQQRSVPSRNGLAPSSSALRLVWTISFDAQFGACTGRGTRSFPGTCRWYRRAAAETGSAPGRTPSAPAAASPKNPCRWSTASPDAGTRQRPRG